MDDYGFTLSEEDQQRFLKIAPTCKLGEIIKLKVEESSSKFILSRIDKKVVKDTVLAFPINIKLNERTNYEFSSAQKLIQPDASRVYDPRFVIPLLYHAVSPSMFVDCRDFIARRCLALTLTGLSSEDSKMRALCYNILDRYYEHLLSALMIDKQLWINLLDLLRNSIAVPNMRLKFLFTTFLCRIIDILLHEKDKMYEMIKEFLSGRPRLRLDTIEIYEDLLFCSDVEYYNNNLRWLLTLLRDGLQTEGDLKMIHDLHVIPQAMCLYGSPLRFDHANTTICSMMIRVALIPGGPRKLIVDYAFLPWLLYHVRELSIMDAEDYKNDPKMESISDTAKSVSSLVFTLIDFAIKNPSASNERIELPRYFELINIFFSMHDLILKSKNTSILEYYISYVKRVLKAIRKDKRLTDSDAAGVFKFVATKMPYLATVT